MGAAGLLASVVSVLLLLPASHAASLSVVGAIDRVWQDVAFQAAEATVAAIIKQTGAQLSLFDVSMDTFQVQVGRQHQLAIEVDGRAYELLINQEAPKQLASSGALHGPQQALPATAAGEQQMPGTALTKATQDPWANLQPLPLPEITLAGPCELVLSHPASVNLWLPHAAEVVRARRILLAPGVALTLSQLKSIGLRRPVELPRLPASYLAEVYATQQLGEPEPGFEASPGMTYLANELYRAATNESFDVSSGGTQLLSFDVEPAGSTLTVSSAAAQPGTPAPRLKVKRQKGGTLEISLRGQKTSEAQLPSSDSSSSRGEGSCSSSSEAGGDRRSCSVSAGAPAPSPAAASPASAGSRGASSEAGSSAAARATLAPQEQQQQQRVDALLQPKQRAWAWPLPLVDMSGWLSYETLLRGILGSHPFDLQQVVDQGIGLKLTRSSVHGVSLLHFELQLRSKGLPGEGDVVDASKIDPNMANAEGAPADGTLEVWEAVVQVVEAPNNKGGVQYVPLNVKRKHAYHSTLTLSPAAVAQLSGGSNSTGTLRGYESVDQGMARAAAQQQ